VKSSGEKSAKVSSSQPTQIDLQTVINCGPFSEGKIDEAHLLTEYGNDLLDDLFEVEQKHYLSNFEDPLGNHDISYELRGKMIDWMIEVTSTFKCDLRTFYMAVAIMDQYYKVNYE
jgi:hypothetical protein